jgi:hypothetical protein
MSSSSSESGVLVGGLRVGTLPLLLPDTYNMVADSFSTE